MTKPFAHETDTAVGPTSLLDLPPQPRSAKARFDECMMAFMLLDAKRRPGVMIDVGAHAGSSMLRFAKAGWKIWAFEPDDRNRARLHATIQNRLGAEAPVEVSKYALSSKESQNVPFYSAEVSSGISGLSAFHRDHKATQFVSTTTLDHVIQNNGIDKIDFLKIDVEGHELDVLGGLDLSLHAPKLIVAEFEDRKTPEIPSASQKLAEHLLSFDYLVFVSEWHPIIEYGAHHSWRSLRKYPTEISENSWGNLIAIRGQIDRVKLAEAAKKSFKANDISSKLRRAATEIAERLF